MKMHVGHHPIHPSTLVKQNGSWIGKSRSFHGKIEKVVALALLGANDSKVIQLWRDLLKVRGCCADENLSYNILGFEMDWIDVVPKNVIFLPLPLIG